MDKKDSKTLKKWLSDYRKFKTLCVQVEINGPGTEILWGEWLKYRTVDTDLRAFYEHEIEILDIKLTKKLHDYTSAARENQRLTEEIVVWRDLLVDALGTLEESVPSENTKAFSYKLRKTVQWGIRGRLDKQQFVDVEKRAIAEMIRHRGADLV